ncbi:hypothetical protein [Leuconostoc mesenteroides]|uniref:hypothetical protein n=1 Tax=Leuconostoc mesenteroides TaxID=1245 RepID=UPI0021DADFB6
MGPLIGGVLATTFSIRMTFFITGIILLCVAFISFYGIQENFQKINTSPTEKLASSKKESVWTVPILILLSDQFLWYSGKLSENKYKSDRKVSLI